MFLTPAELEQLPTSISEKLLHAEKIIDQFITYPEAEIEKEGNAYRVTVLDKSCRLKPITIEMQTSSERNNPEEIAFLTQQNLLGLMWIDGDEELKSSKMLDYHMPVLRILKKLREKHILTVKNA